MYTRRRITMKAVEGTGISSPTVRFNICLRFFHINNGVTTIDMRAQGKAKKKARPIMSPTPGSLSVYASQTNDANSYRKKQFASKYTTSSRVDSADMDGIFVFISCLSQRHITL